MISRYEAVLNGISLGSISSDILIHDISHSPAQFRDDVFQVAKRNGSRLYRRYFESASVSIKFEIHSYSISQRQAICDAVNAWAKDGGILMTNDRNGQFLQCVCSEFPSVQSARNWTDELTVSFEAYSVPFWQESVYQSVSATGTSWNGTFWVPGSGDKTFVEAEILANASLSSVGITVNGRTLTLSGLSVSSGSTIKIAYDSDGIQSIKVGSTSLLNKRTGVDDLLADCSKNNTFSFTSSASVTVTLKARGLWV